MLKQQIQSEISKAVKEGDGVTTSTLRMLCAAILSEEKEKRYKLSKAEAGLNEAELNEKSALTEEEIIEVVSSEAKKRKEAILSFEQGNRPELAQKEKKELEILMKYMPEQISEEELKKLVKEAIEKTGAKEIKDMGKIMAELMPKVKGRADGGQISKIAKELL
jgi:hypothetical protein